VEPGKHRDSASPDAAIEIAGVRLTHPDRVLWEAQGITKRRLAEFYGDIADRALPHLVNRPLSLVRCPSGLEKTCFFAKHAWSGLVDAIRPVDLGDSKPMLVIGDLAGLIGLVQAGVLEIHPWGSTLDAVDCPDRLVFDFDPGEGVDWASVVAAAREARDRLAGFGLESFVKTSGGKGLHVVVPLVPEVGWKPAKAFAKAIAEAMAAESPSRYVARMAKKLRGGRIFVDYLRNDRGQTAVAAYSTRAREGAPVSTPLAWDELATSEVPRFTIETLRHRLDRLARDPWDGFFALRQRLPRSEAPQRPRRSARPRLSAGS
jgi:bifunctional non-homologous end joining protein LigD